MQFLRIINRELGSFYIVDFGINENLFLNTSYCAVHANT